VRNPLVNTDRPNTSPEKQDGLESQSSPSKKIQGKRGKAGSSKKMTAKEQSEQFIKTARELESDEDGEQFYKLIDQVASYKYENR